MTGKGSVNHNSRKFHAKNTDPERSCLNVEYCNENIKDVYHELFDEALARYNEKQTRSDRRIDDYYEKICSGKQEKPFHEIILQIGNKDDMGAKTEDGQLAAKILDKYMQDFQQRNLTGEYKKLEPDCRKGVRAQLERMKELCKERNSLYEKQNDLKEQKWKIEKSLERKEIWGVAVAMPCIFVVNRNRKWYNQIGKGFFSRMYWRRLSKSR